MRYYLSNSFHKTETYMHVQLGDKLTERRVRRAKRRLCSARECTCSDELGRRGEQPFNAMILVQYSDHWRVL